MFLAAGTVNAHVDLAGLAEKDLTLSSDGKSVELRLPKRELDKPNIDHDRSHVYRQRAADNTKAVLTGLFGSLGYQVTLRE